MHKVTLLEILQQIGERKNFKITDNTICGKCSKCGECCSNFLPVTQNEVDIIEEYVIKNNIKPQKQNLIMKQQLTCPYYDGKKCLIYEVRPLICKAFYCNKMPDYEEAKELQKEKRIPVNMWGIADEIEKERKKYRRKINGRNIY